MRPDYVLRGLLAACLLAPLYLAAAEPQNTIGNPQERELRESYEAAGKVAQHGPVDVPVAKQATLKLPSGYVYVPSEAAKRLLLAMGNRPGDNLQGMIFPGNEHPQSGWFVVLRWSDSGYIKDDDARDWDANAMLEQLKEGTEEANRERKTRGIPELEIEGWVEKPTYDSAANRLVWSISSREKGAGANSDPGINYNTFALGREGYTSMNLVTDLKSINSQRDIAKTLLAALGYLDGKRYADFNPATDKVAAYGIAALVGVAAAKKLGLLAALGIFMVKFWKIIAIAGIALVGVLTRLRKKRADTPMPPPAA